VADVTGAKLADSSVPTAAPPVLVSLRDVTVRYTAGRKLFGRSDSEIVALDNVSLEIRQGRSLGLVGRTGSGKSTIAQLVMGMIQPTEGTVTVAGSGVARTDATEAAGSRHGVQLVPQDPYSSLDPRMHVRDLVAEPITRGRRRQGKKQQAAVRARVRELLDLVGLPASAAELYPNEFSGGQRQRIAIARALSSEPSLIVLDEPTSALDVSIRAQILNLMWSLHEQLGVTYLTISHDINTVSYLSDEVAVIDSGRLVELGPNESVLTSPHHACTLQLVECVPGASAEVLSLSPRQTVTVDFDTRTGCLFRSRCPLYFKLGEPTECSSVTPEWRVVEKGRHIACHFYEQTGSLLD
jgi:oligopeptide/dipeptide ABC transporter ATP-binding protein